MNKSDLEKLVSIRLVEAETLLSTGHYPGAYYLGGYALECALKVCIAKQVNQYDFPNRELAKASYTHKLTELVGVAGLKQALFQNEKDDAEFSLNWAVAKDWSESSRYEYDIEETRAKDLLSAATDENSGILAWLKTFW